VNHLAASYSCLFVRKFSEFIFGSRNSDYFERRCYMFPNKRKDVLYCKINHGENSDYPYNDVTENEGESDFKKSIFTQDKVEFILEKECIFLIGNMSFNIRFQEGTLATIATIHGGPKVLILPRKIYTILNAFNMAKLS
jgi:hypothetical protein